MQSFLGQLADYYLNHYPQGINDVCFVFPGRRAGLFFKKHIKERIDYPIWSPKILTITDLFVELSGLHPADNISLLFKLHATYCRITKQDSSIDDFIPFGETILNDFNDIDKHFIDAKKLYANLTDYKKLEDDYEHLSKDQVAAIQSYWNSFNPDKLSKHQNEFLGIWENMFELYSEFRNDLIAANEAYEGMMYRVVADKINTEKIIETPYKHIVFAGFNALNKCERKLFNSLNLQKKAAFFWDYPEWLIKTGDKDENEAPYANHEATIFIKQNLLDFPSPKNWINPENKELPDITVFSAPNDLTMAQVTHNFLKDNLSAESSDTEDIAVILADENLLFPVLHTIPPEIENINVTIGYPVKNTPAYSLIENLLMLQKMARTNKKGETWFYHQSLLALIRHQYMNVFLGENQAGLVQKIIKSGLIFIEKSFLGDLPLINKIFVKVETSQELASYLDNILSHILQTPVTDKESRLEREFIYYLHTVIKRLSDILSQHNSQIAPDTWLKFFKQLAGQLAVPFEGEPLTGLQIMGILETRTLDFKKVIVLGMNEGILPRTSLPDTLIPFNLRKGHGLPTIENQDAIYANYFYRLINRAQKAHLVYSTTKTVTGEGEMSRFLQQLYYEYPKKINIETVIQKVKPPTPKLLKASKNEEVLSLMDKWTTEASALSPSALSVYIECPLQFYFKYVANLKESDQIDEDLDPRVFGNLFHKAVEILYNPFIGKSVTNNDLQAILENTAGIKDCITKVLHDIIPFAKQSDFTDLQGKHGLVREVLFKYIKRFLQLEIQTAPFTLVNLEERIKKPYTLSSGKTIYIGGIIDRVDIKDNQIRVIDYKTGQAGQAIKSIEDLFAAKKHSDTKAVFQTLVYSYIKSLENAGMDIAPCVMSVKKLFSPSFSESLILKPDRSSRYTITFNLVGETFMQYFDELLSEIFNPDISFTQTENKKTCGYCLFREHCG